MMSQRRQEQKDRLRALNDYKVNLKAELEIRHLHEKVDHLLNRQWERLTEIQQIQIEMMRDQAKKTERALKAVKSAKPPQKKKAKARQQRRNLREHLSNEVQCLPFTRPWMNSSLATTVGVRMKGYRSGTPMER